MDDVDELATEKPADELLNIADGLSLVDYNEVVDDDTAEGFRPASADVLKTGSTTKPEGPSGEYMQHVIKFNWNASMQVNIEFIMCVCCIGLFKFKLLL